MRIEFRRQDAGCGLHHPHYVGHQVPASVPLVCVDINAATLTKLADRGSTQTTGVVTDVGLFLGALADELAPVGAGRTG